MCRHLLTLWKFQHTAARRRLPYLLFCAIIAPVVSTHSRPKAAAGIAGFVYWAKFIVSTHSRPKAAASSTQSMFNKNIVSTHSRPKAAAKFCTYIGEDLWSFNTQPPEGGCLMAHRQQRMRECFNTQPPEGGCFFSRDKAESKILFQHTAARRRLLPT